MLDLPKPSRVDNAAGLQDRQAGIKTLDDVPARYRNYPDFEALTIDPAHNGNQIGKIIREAMAAAEADLSGILKGPVSRPDSPYIDFYDGEGYPFDVKTPLSPTKNDRWEFNPYQNAETILKQLDKDHNNKFTGKREPVAVLLDTTYMKPEDRQALWHELRKKTKENRAILKRIFEVNVKLDKEQTHEKKIEPNKLPILRSLLWGKLGR